jgi:hypothetical protein
MSDEFDDILERRLLLTGPKPRNAPQADSTPRLIGRVYVASDRGLRAKLLACLLRPLSPLGRAAVAAGAFAKFVASDSLESILAAMDEATRFSNDQIAELARFVRQVSPQALERFARLAADNRVGMTAFNIAAATLLLQTLSHSRA